MPMANPKTLAASPVLESIRQQLDNLLAQIESDRQALAAEQAVVARATEALHESPALQSALSQGQEIMRDRVVALIDEHLHQLQLVGTNAVALQTLRRRVLEVEA